MTNVENITLHPWWRFAKLCPQYSNQVSSVMSLLMGGQPKGLGRNFVSIRCGICGSTEPEKPTHVLFRCITLNHSRDKWWGLVINSMPDQMVIECRNMTDDKKVAFLMSCFGNTMITEWTHVYRAVGKFVHNMYIARSEAYDISLRVLSKTGYVLGLSAAHI